MGEADDVSAGTDDRVIALFLITESSVVGWSEGRVGLGNEVDASESRARLGWMELMSASGWS